MTNIVFLASSCSQQNNNDISLSFISSSRVPTICYELYQNLEFVLKTKDAPNVTISDFQIMSAFENPQDLNVFNLRKNKNYVYGEIYVMNTDDTFTNPIYQSALIYHDVKCPFQLVKKPTISITKSTGGDEIEYGDTTEYSFYTDIQYNWPIYWEWDSSLPTWCTFQQNYWSNKISVTNNNQDEFDFRSVDTELTCHYYISSVSEDIHFTNNRGRAIVPNSYFQFNSNKIITGFNTGNASLSAFDTVVIPFDTASIADCSSGSTSFFSSTKTSSIDTIIFNSGSNCTSIGTFSFSNNAALENIVFSQNINEIKANAFANCTSLIEVYFLSRTPPSTFGTNAFEDVTDRLVYVPAGSKSLYDTADFRAALHVESDDIVED